MITGFWGVITKNQNRELIRLNRKWLKKEIQRLPADAFPPASPARFALILLATFNPKVLASEYRLVNLAKPCLVLPKRTKQQKNRADDSIEPFVS